IERPRQLLEDARPRAELEPLPVGHDRACAREQDERRLLRAGQPVGLALDALDAEREVAPARAFGGHAVPVARSEQEAHAPDYGCPVADPTIRLTTAQALVRYLQAQQSERDGERRRLIPGVFGIFGHGNVHGIGQALDEFGDELTFFQGRNEQSMVHAAAAFAKATRRRATLAVSSSIGPGATNMITGAAAATINRVPVLLLPGDTSATRLQGPVLQQLEHPSAGDVSVNDCFRPVARFFDRITRPEQLLTALPEAMRVLTSPVETGAVVIALPQDVQSHAYD